MTMEAIVYTTQTGSSRQYAQLLAEKIGCSAYSLARAKETIPADSEILYVGWVSASTVKGYAAAAKRYNIRAVCAVGMGQTGTQTDVIRGKNSIPDSVPIFTLQGNFDVKKLHGVYRVMMDIMVKTAGKALADKPDRTPEEDDLLDMMINGGNRVSPKNLSAVLDWYEEKGKAK